MHSTDNGMLLKPASVDGFSDAEGSEPTNGISDTSIDNTYKSTNASANGVRMEETAAS